MSLYLPSQEIVSGTGHTVSYSSPCPISNSTAQTMKSFCFSQTPIQQWVWGSSMVEKFSVMKMCHLCTGAGLLRAPTSILAFTVYFYVTLGKSQPYGSQVFICKREWNEVVEKRKWNNVYKKYAMCPSGVLLLLFVCFPNPHPLMPDLGRLKDSGLPHFMLGTL